MDVMLPKDGLTANRESVHINLFCKDDSAIEVMANQTTNSFADSMA